jgi:hypothetical protein
MTTSNCIFKYIFPHPAHSTGYSSNQYFSYVGNRGIYAEVWALDHPSDEIRLPTKYALYMNPPPPFV